MCARTMLVGWTVALAVSTACAAQTGVRAIDVTGLNLGDASGGNVEEPVLISNIDELYNTIVDEQALLAITAAVLFPFTQSMSSLVALAATTVLVTTWQGDPLSTPPDSVEDVQGAFDVALLFETLEHLPPEDGIALLASIRKKLAPDGHGNKMVVAKRFDGHAAHRRKALQDRALPRKARRGGMRLPGGEARPVAVTVASPWTSSTPAGVRRGDNVPVPGPPHLLCLRQNRLPVRLQRWHRRRRRPWCTISFWSRYRVLSVHGERSPGIRLSVAPVARGRRACWDRMNLAASRVSIGPSGPDRRNHRMPARSRP